MDPEDRCSSLTTWRGIFKHCGVPTSGLLIGWAVYLLKDKYTNSCIGIGCYAGLSLLLSCARLIPKVEEKCKKYISGGAAAISIGYALATIYLIYYGVAITGLDLYYTCAFTIVGAIMYGVDSILHSRKCIVTPSTDTSVGELGPTPTISQPIDASEPKSSTLSSEYNEELPLRPRRPEVLPIASTSQGTHVIRREPEAKSVTPSETPSPLLGDVKFRELRKRQPEEDSDATTYTGGVASPEGVANLSSELSSDAPVPRSDTSGTFSPAREECELRVREPGPVGHELQNRLSKFYDEEEEEDEV